MNEQRDKPPCLKKELKENKTVLNALMSAKIKKTDSVLFSMLKIIFVIFSIFGWFFMYFFILSAFLFGNGTIVLNFNAKGELIVETIIFTIIFLFILIFGTFILIKEMKQGCDLK